ncbi:MAG: prepilin-type N-terminal cleavage/methylation domain-containing protein [Kiritimatiellia bacterium]|jgi:prepilin-type N-terminal cleavage/methylation domain-containing protein
MATSLPRPAHSRAGFSLVETLVAVAVLAVVGAIAASALFAVQHVWERSARPDTAEGARALLDAVEADLSACPGGDGFEGDARSCAFPVLRPQAAFRAPPRLRLVRYHLLPDAFVRTESDLDGETGLQSRREPLPGPARFDYGSQGSDGTLAWTGELPAGTAAPDVLRVAIGSVERLISRR